MSPPLWISNGPSLIYWRKCSDHCSLVSLLSQIKTATGVFLEFLVYAPRLSILARCLNDNSLVRADI